MATVHIITFFFFWSDLCLNVIASDDVSHSSQRRRGNLVVSVPVKRELFMGCYVVKSTAMSGSERTWAARRGACRHQSQWRLGSCHWGRLRGKTRPSMRLPAGLGHCWIKVWTALAGRATPENTWIIKCRSKIVPWINTGRCFKRYLFKSRWRVFASAEIGQGPYGISRHSQSCGFGQKPEQKEQHSCIRSFRVAIKTLWSRRLAYINNGGRMLQFST